MSKALNYLGIARKAGLLETGEENAGMAIRNGKGKLLILASDASDNARRRAENFAAGTKIPLLPVPLRKEDIAQATGKTGCSMAVFEDIGLAESFASALAQEYGGNYSVVAGQLKEQAARSEQRRKEAKANPGSKKLGKRRNNV